MKDVLKFVVLLLVISISFNGCESKYKEKPIKIAVSNWVGYTPLLYAYEKGKLTDLNIDIVPTSSLGVSLNFIHKGIVDGFCATQREYGLLKDAKVDMVPIVLLDRSNGGDKILSNMSREKLYSLKNANIDVYMEYDSANYILFEYFKKIRDWHGVNFIIKDSTQKLISDMNIVKPSIVVTYEPYSNKLMKKGFNFIESTKNESLLISDILFVKRDDFKKNKARYQKLKVVIDDALKDLIADPKSFYNAISIYLDGESFEDFNASLKDIYFINWNKNKVIEQLKNEKIETENIL